MTSQQKEQYRKDKQTLAPWDLFCKYRPQPLEFKRACQVAQEGYFDYLAASWAANVAAGTDALSADEWRAENGGVPEGLLARVVAPAAARLTVA